MALAQLSQNPSLTIRLRPGSRTREEGWGKGGPTAIIDFTINLVIKKLIFLL